MRLYRSAKYREGGNMKHFIILIIIAITIGALAQTAAMWGTKVKEGVGQIIVRNWGGEYD
jgi:hypothetical protein